VRTDSKGRKRSCAIAAATIILASAARAQETLEQRVDALEKELKELRSRQETPQSDENLRIFWNDGLRLENPDKSIKLRIGGFSQVDAIAGSSDPAMRSAGLDIEDGAEIRRARIFMYGSVGDYFAFRSMYDFADTNKVKVSDLWGEVRRIPFVDNFRVGQFWEPLSLEQLTLDVEADFMERSVMNALSPARNIGAALHDDYGGRFTWWLGAFVDDGGGDPAIAQGDGDHAFTSRIAGLLYDTAEDASFVHVGASASYRTPTGGTVVYATRPESHLAPVFVTTGTMTGVDRVLLLGVEVAAQDGPLHVSAEFLESHLDASAQGDPTFPGWYVNAGWFITGEHQGYNHSDGVITSPRVSRPYGSSDGIGAFELVGRYSSLDLDSGGVRGGRITDAILGLNWYLNHSIRFAVDGVHSRVDGVGDSKFLELWFQVWF
jgi:phosphate-selective porin OprO/OprP